MPPKRTQVIEAAPADRLAAITALASLTPAERARIDQICVWKRHKAGEQIVDRNSHSRDVFFVVEGRVEVVNYSISGREVAYATVGAGGLFGELSAIDGEPRSANVVAAEPCLLAVLAPQQFQDMLRSHPDLAMDILRRLARVVRTCDERIMDLATLGAVQRVHLELLRLCQPDPATGNLWVVYPMPRQHEIARRAATTRETVARVLGQLQSGGLIRRKERSLYINDKAALERLAERLDPKAPGTGH